MAILDRAGRKTQVHLWRGSSSLFCAGPLAFSTILPCIKFKTQVASEQKLRNETLDHAAQFSPNFSPNLQHFPPNSRFFGDKSRDVAGWRRKECLRHHLAVESAAVSDFRGDCDVAGVLWRVIFFKFGAICKANGLIQLGRGCILSN